MRRKEIATLIERYDEHERYGELTEDDRITHWLMKKVFELTKDEKEEPEVEKKIDYVVYGGNPAPDPWWNDVQGNEVHIVDVAPIPAAFEAPAQVRPVNRPAAGNAALNRNRFNWREMVAPAVQFGGGRNQGRAAQAADQDIINQLDAAAEQEPRE